MAKYSIPFLFILILNFLLVAVCYLTAVRAAAYRDSVSPFECGFDPHHSARAPFSLRFFLLAVVFLIFDVEISILLPVLFIAPSMHSLVGCGSAIAFLCLLLVGLFHEWREGSLDWL